MESKSCVDSTTRLECHCEYRNTSLVGKRNSILYKCRANAFAFIVRVNSQIIEL
jgi:hypothetical protein